MVNYKSPSNLHQIGTVSKYEFIKMWKRKRILTSLLLSIGFPLIILIIIPLIMIFGFDFRYFGTSFPFLIAPEMLILPMILIIVPLILATDSLSIEYQNETGLLLFVQPIHKSIIFLGKYLTCFILNISFIAVIYLITFTSGFFFFNPIIVFEVIYPLFLSFIIAILFSTAYLSIIYFLNSLTNRALITSAIMVFLSFIISQFIVPFYIPPHMSDFGWFIPYFNLPLISQMLINVNIFETNVMITFYYPEPDIIISLFVVAFYSIAPFISTIFWEQRKYLK